MAQVNLGGDDVVTVKHTVTLTRSNAETRVAINEEEGSLVRGWEENDKILVTSAEGQKFGVMSLEDSESGVFSGDLVIPRNFSEGTVNYIYMGSDADVEAATASTAQFSEAYSFNPVATVDELGANDVLSLTAKAKVVKGLLVKEDGESNRLKSQVAYGHFALEFPEGVNYNNEKVTVYGNSYLNSAKIDFMTGKLADAAANEATFSGDDMYLTMVPTQNFEVNFKVNIDGIEWLGTLTRSEIKGGAYYRKTVSEGENNAVMVKMERAFTITYDINGGSATNFPDPATATKKGTDKVKFDLPTLTPTDATFVEFKGWSLDADATEGSNSIEVSKDETVYAIWGDKKVELTICGYDNDGTTSLGEYSREDADIDHLTLSTDNLDKPSKDGYEFKGWSLTRYDAFSKDATISTDIFVVDVEFTADEVRAGTTSKNVYAVWQKLESTGDFTLPGGTGTDW